MEPFRQFSWYLSRRIELPVVDAARALDEVVWETKCRVRQAQLRFGPRAAVAPEVAPFVARRWYAQLQTPRLAGRFTSWWPIELELTAWSPTQSALGLRPTRPLPKWRTDSYFAVANECVVEIGSALAACPRQQPVGELRVA